MAARVCFVRWPGASRRGSGLLLLECLLQAQKTVYLMLSPAAQIVLAQETDLKVPGTPAEQEKYFSARYRAREGQLRVFGPNAWCSPPASGSQAPRAIVGCPRPRGALAR